MSTKWILQALNSEIDFPILMKMIQTENDLFEIVYLEEMCSNLLPGWGYLYPELEGIVSDEFLKGYHQYSCEIESKLNNHSLYCDAYQHDVSLEDIIKELRYE